MNSYGTNPQCDECPLCSLKMIGACQSCGKPVRSGSHFCSFCGSPNTKRAKETEVCPSCGASAKSNAQFCSSCGDSLRTPQESGMKPEVSDIVSQGRSDASNERRRTVIKIVDVGRVLVAPEPVTHDEEVAGVEIFYRSGNRHNSKCGLGTRGSAWSYSVSSDCSPDKQ